MSERRRLWACFAAATCLLAGQSLLRHFALRTAMFDLGIHHQVSWLLSWGYQPMLSTRGLHAFADHFNPIAGWFALCAWVVDSEVGPLLLQSLALAAGVFPVYALARRRLGPKASLAAAVLYLVQPSLLYVARFDVHFMALLIPAALAAAWALEAAPPALYAGYLGLMLSTTEAAGFCVLLMAWPAARLRGWRWGAGTAAVALLGLALATASLKAHSEGLPTQYLTLYSAWGHDGPSIVTTLLSNPARVARELGTEQNLRLVLLLLLPLAGLPLLSPSRAAPCLPILLGNLLSWREAQHTLTQQYAAGMIPFLVWAALDGLGLLQRKQARAVPVVLALALLFAARESPLGRERLEGFPPVIRALSKIPQEASVATDNVLGARLADREALFLFPNPFQAVAWGNHAQALVEQSSYATFPSPPAALRRALRACPVDYVALWLPDNFPSAEPRDRWYYLWALLSSREYGVVYFEDRLLILRRGAPWRAADAERVLRVLP